jgi:Ricin-type beta-trefoil lectin domain
MYARVYVGQLTVIQQTPNDDRDEVYFVVSGRSQAGNFHKPRVPEPPNEYEGNDYYGLHAGEAAFDSPTHRITLWQGWIDHGSFVSLATIVREQDGPAVSDIILGIPSIAGSILTGNITSAISEIENLATSIVNAASQDHHETVGAFTLVLKNQDHQRIFKWVALPGTTNLLSADSKPSAEFSCTGSSANYHVQADVQQWMQIDARHSGMTLDVRGDSLSAGAPIQQFGWHGGNNQLWEIIPVEDPYVRIQSKRSGLCLDVADASQADGAPVNQYPWHGGHNQQWKIESVETGWSRIINRNSNKCLDVRDASAHSQARVQQFSCHGQDNQSWRIS